MGNVIRDRNDPNATLELQSTAVNFTTSQLCRNILGKGQMAVSNIVYGSFGRGGGTQLRGNTALFDPYGQCLDLSGLGDENITGTAFLPAYDLDAVDDTTKYKSGNFILANMNNHYWYGLLSSSDHKINSAWSLAFGVDFSSDFCGSGGMLRSFDLFRRRLCGNFSNCRAGYTFQLFLPSQEIMSRDR